MNTGKIYETIESVRKLSETMAESSIRRQRLEYAVGILDKEFKLLHDEEAFVNEVIAMAKERFGNMANAQVFAMFAMAQERAEKPEINRDNIHEVMREGKWDKKKIAVKQYTLEGKYVASYSSINEASKAVSVSACSISAALNGSSLSSAGFIWKRADDITPVIPCIIKTTNYPKPVGQYSSAGNLVNTFPSIRQAAKSVGVCETSMHRVLDKDKMLRYYYWKTIE